MSLDFVFCFYFCYSLLFFFFFFFFFNDTATTEIYTLSLHDALPISFKVFKPIKFGLLLELNRLTECQLLADRKSTRLNSSHQIISYAVFCLKKKKKKKKYKIKQETKNIT